MSCQKTNLSDQEKELCDFAVALRPAKNRHILDTYLVGEIEVEKITRWIVHNNRYHGCGTREQLGHLILIMEERKIFGMKYEAIKIINEIEKNVEQYFKLLALNGDNFEDKDCIFLGVSKGTAPKNVPREGEMNQ